MSPSSTVLRWSRSRNSAMLSSMSSSAMAATAQQHQWSEEETREFIRIRADLERDLTAVSTGEGPATKKKTLWEMASARMRERGFWRTADQCKCKWKNLLSRYKVGPVLIRYHWFEIFRICNLSLFSVMFRICNLRYTCFDLSITKAFDGGRSKFVYFQFQVPKVKSAKASNWNVDIDGVSKNTGKKMTG